MGSKAMMTVKVDSMNDLNRENIKKVKRAKHPMSRRTKFTIIAVINIIWYTLVVLLLSFLDKHVPSELTVAWFSAWTVELALLFGIKVKSINAEAKLNSLGIFDEADTVESFGPENDEDETECDDTVPTEDDVPYDGPIDGPGVG